MSPIIIKAVLIILLVEQIVLVVSEESNLSSSQLTGKFLRRWINKRSVSTDEASHNDSENSAKFIDGLVRFENFENQLAPHTESQMRRKKAHHHLKSLLRPVMAKKDSIRDTTKAKMNGKEGCHLGLGMGFNCHANSITKYLQFMKLYSDPRLPGRK